MRQPDKEVAKDNKALESYLREMAFSIPITIKLREDKANATTSWADVQGLSFPVAAYKDYYFKFYLAFQTPATTTGFAFGLNGPESPTFLHVRVVYQTTVNGTAGTGTTTEVFYTGYDAMNVTSTSVAANTNIAAIIEGIFSNGANSGTLALRFKSEVNTSAITVKKGSVCIYY